MVCSNTLELSPKAFCYSLWKVDIFQGITLPDAPRFGKVFGGQMIGQV